MGVAPWGGTHMPVVRLGTRHACKRSYLTLNGALYLFVYESKAFLRDVANLRIGGIAPMQNCGFYHISYYNYTASMLPSVCILVAYIDGIQGSFIAILAINLSWLWGRPHL